MGIIIGLAQVGIPVALIFIGLFAGRITEYRHLRSLARRERELAHMLLTDLKTFPPATDPSRHASMVVGEVCIATDYLKTFLAGLRKIIGGELRSYESLMSRARREAMLRMMSQAVELGHNAVNNVRLYSTDIGGGTRRKGSAMVEMFAVGTAYTVRSDA